MNPFAFACIAPHGSELLEALAGPDPARMALTRGSLHTLGERMRAAAPGALVVLTPHGTRAEGQFTVADSERLRGTVEDHGAAVTLERRVDRPLARAIAAEALADGLPVAVLNFGTSEGPLSCLPLDWGALIPLHFMPDVPVVVINPPRGPDFTPHLRFGQALARAVAASGQRVGLIASCDWSHTHDKDGPYGYHPAAAHLDAQVADCIRRGDLESLASLDPRLVEDAKPDGLWQTLVLAGAIPSPARRVQLLSYEAPTYFGLLCAGFSTCPEA
ncbi:extradiol ring-cleavage dioxygenase (plasmid) [Deinococcus metallilatus]|uniref:Aromatic ring-opening dioxygenase LigB subunit n=1 Tax=Deinococcus metallilatus TaxID=1211322 RepID=A0AAJ5FBQ2_9DEIO|nr:extradiol ring-cleavage dioxygenase [Deinococcus metallilatus]MBB5297277.1 aromatic ring-opening dioxygenase LigB subunit [Deinococcus metallilatus]QBY06976.1 extradiol ring-cleavage dioxygenase [Deinococcus metallilatus]TLK31923.1 extradiol ring-cleavage dioxygenase [Deinococcus metallilatus]GMA17159.1 extradiol dioxygenase [Deinococcus metallilatus]